MNLHFQDIRRQHHITREHVAEAAGVLDKEVYFFEIGILQDQVKKEKIVAAFAQLTNHPYRLSDFEISLQEALRAGAPGRERKN